MSSETERRESNVRGVGGNGVVLCGKNDETSHKTPESTKAKGYKESTEILKKKEGPHDKKKVGSVAPAAPEMVIGRNYLQQFSLDDKEQIIGAVPSYSSTGFGKQPPKTAKHHKIRNNQGIEPKPAINMMVTEKAKNRTYKAQEQWIGKNTKTKLSTPESLVNPRNILPSPDSRAQILSALSVSTTKARLEKFPPKASRPGNTPSNQERETIESNASNNHRSVISQPPHISMDRKTCQPDVNYFDILAPTFAVAYTQGLNSNVSNQETQASLDVGPEILVSATLVDEFESMESRQRDDDQEIVAIAKKVSKGKLYIGKTSVHWCCVGIIISIIVISVAVPLILRNRPINPNGTCGSGEQGNGVCKDGSCCSPFGWCGDTPGHCDANITTPEENSTFPGVDENMTEPIIDKNITKSVGPIDSDKICGGYYPDWFETPKVRNIHPNYNLVYLFSARPSGSSDGSVSFTPQYDMEELKIDIQHERSVNHRAFILSVGGFGNAFYLDNRSFSETLLDSVTTIYDEIGGIDGLDWDMYSDGIEPSTEEMIWVSLELKDRYPGFIISSTAVPYRQGDKDFCYAAVSAGALDYCAPKFYDAPGFTAASSVLEYVREWVGLVGEEHLVIGLALNYELDHFQTTEQAIQIYNSTKSEFQGIRGVFNWHISYD